MDRTTPPRSQRRGRPNPPIAPVRSTARSGGPQTPGEARVPVTSPASPSRIPPVFLTGSRRPPAGIPSLLEDATNPVTIPPQTARRPRSTSLHARPGECRGQQRKEPRGSLLQQVTEPQRRDALPGAAKARVRRRGARGGTGGTREAGGSARPSLHLRAGSQGGMPTRPFPWRERLRNSPALAIPPSQAPVKALLVMPQVRSVALCGLGPDGPPPTGWAIPHPLRSISSIPITLPTGPNGVRVAASRV